MSTEQNKTNIDNYIEELMFFHRDPLKCSVPQGESAPTLTGGVAAYELGNAVELMEAAKTTKRFAIDGVNIGLASAKDGYRLIMYADGVEFYNYRFRRDSAFDTACTHNFRSRIFAAGKQRA